MVKVVFEPESDRSAAYDDDKFIGESTYSKSDKLWIIDHTYVDDKYRGQGIAGKLVATIVDEARTNDKKIIPLCPFAKREFELKPEYRDTLPTR